MYNYLTYECRMHIHLIPGQMKNHDSYMNRARSEFRTACIKKAWKKQKKKPRALRFSESALT